MTRTLGHAVELVGWMWHSNFSYLSFYIGSLQRTQYYSLKKWSNSSYILTVLPFWNAVEQMMFNLPVAAASKKNHPNSQSNVGSVGRMARSCLVVNDGRTDPDCLRGRVTRSNIFRRRCAAPRPPCGPSVRDSRSRRTLVLVLSSIQSCAI